VNVDGWDAGALLELIESATKPGRRSDWPACGAKLRGPRAGRICQAAGSGVGGRCHLHGGVPSKRPKGVTEPRRFVLFSNIDWRAPDRWFFWAVPADLFEQLPPATRHYPDAESMPSEIAEVMRARGSHGVDRFGAGVRWPQAFGFRIVKRLAERGRVAFVIFSDANRRAVLRAQRERVPEGQPPTRTQRVDGEAFARAMAQAGQRLNAPKLPATRVPRGAGYASGVQRSAAECACPNETTRHNEPHTS
jgi:hypothetical protein